MKSIFDEATREEIISRINSVTETSTAQWGKMNVYQMLKHCTLWSGMILGRKKYKRAFIGRIFGRMWLRNSVKDDRPMQRSTPTIPEFIITGNGNVEAQKKEWIALVKEHAHFTNYDFIHPFFGKMTKEQIGIHAYKHCDHHLRQFNC